MKEPNPVVEALEKLQEMYQSNTAAKALPLARSMAEKLEAYDNVMNNIDELVEAKTGLEWVIRNFGHTLNGMMKLSFHQDTCLSNYADCPAIIKRYLENKP